MKTKPATSNSTTSNSSGSKSAPRKPSHSRDRDKKRSGPSGESGASSQCDTPPLNEKESLSHGKFAGISPESVQCMGEQVLTEQLSSDACSSLAEDVSYKLRQLIHNIALHSRQTKTHRVDVDDVNTVLRLMDTEPILGPSQPQWIAVGDIENLCAPSDPIIDVIAIATQQQSFLTVEPPTLSVAWITDNKNISGNNLLSSTLQNYYTKISRAILSHNKQLARVALRDLSTNTHIGPIVPNLMNLSIFLLSEECMPVMMPSAHEVLYNQALNILDSLLINPCCSDTDVTLQLQRLFPVLVSNVLTESTLSDKMCRIMMSIVTVWPQLAHIGRGIVLEYLSQGVEERLSAPLVACLAALGRKALVDGLLSHFDLIMSSIRGENIAMPCPGLYEAILNASHVFLRPSSAKYHPEMSHIDEFLFEILGDALIPRRIHCLCPEKIEEPPPEPQEFFDPSNYFQRKASKRKPKIKILKQCPIKKEDNGHFPDSQFDVANNSIARYSQFSQCIQFNFAGCRPLQIRRRRVLDMESPFMNSFPNGNRYAADRKVTVVVAKGLLTRFKYIMPGERRTHTNFSLYTL